MHSVAPQTAQHHFGLKCELFESGLEFFCRCTELLGAFAKRLQGV